ncbi:MAG: hypothetical protein HY962_12430 [Ignavibacteriae bacterium]|nr:hypothetical protein [Ignavibacteriota bacterium]
MTQDLIGTRGDTLAGKVVYQNSRGADGGRLPLTASEAGAMGLDMSEAIHIVLHDESQVFRRGDTLLIPMQAIDLVRTQEVNPGFVAGVVVGSAVGFGAVVLAVLALSAFAALIALL